MGMRRWSFEEPTKPPPVAPSWRFTLGLMAGLAICGAAAIQYLR